MAGRGARPLYRHVHGPECGVIVLEGGPFSGQGWFTDDWDEKQRERAEFAKRAGRHSPFLDYVKTSEIKNGAQIAVYQPPPRGQR